MARTKTAALMCAAVGAVVAGCAHHGGIAAKSVEVTTEAGGQVASGLGRAATTPLRDLNLIRERIPAVLIRAEDRPYDIFGLESCDGILAEVTALDEALGPDLDQPRVDIDGMHKGASYAAQAALDGVKDLAEGVIPMRSWVKRLSGATRAESEARRAVVAGSVRRGFLKALGMTRNCEWPAAPMGFTPTQIAALAPAPPAKPPVPPQPDITAPLSESESPGPGAVLKAPAVRPAPSPTPPTPHPSRTD
jgi:hypothetical protein